MTPLKSVFHMLSERPARLKSLFDAISQSRQPVSRRERKLTGPDDASARCFGAGRLVRRRPPHQYWGCARKGMRRQPKVARRDDRLDATLTPPGQLIAVAVELSVMASAERDRELVTDLAA